MDNLSKIKKFSRSFHFLISVLLVLVPLYYVIYWALINHLPDTLITVNVEPAPIVPYHMPPLLQMAGFAASLFPLAALLYGLVNLRKLFSLYRDGSIFSFAHVTLFTRISKALLLWVISSMLYESIKSILFSMGNPPGQRVVSVGLGSAETTTLIIAGIVFVIARVMDEGRILWEDHNLTV